MALCNKHWFYIPQKHKHCDMKQKFHDTSDNVTEVESREISGLIEWI